MIRVALLTAGFGDGHHQVAQALVRVFDELGAQTEVFDCSRGAHTLLPISERIYELSTKYFPEVYGASYRITAGFGEKHPLWRLLSIPSVSRLHKGLEAYNPQAVLRLFPDHSLHNIPASFQQRPFIGTVLTDFSIHGRWFQPNVDVYYVPHPLLVQGAKKFANAGAKVVDCGIPLRRQFSTPEIDESVPMVPYILVATGGRGLFPELQQTVQKVRQIWTESHVYVLCGRNASMLQSIEALKEKDALIHALPFIENVAAWYRGAQFAVIKAGGITVAECLASACPMVLFRPTPGQEGDNALFVQRLGAAKMARNLKAFAEILEKLGTDGELDKMRQSCREARRMSAAETVARDVLQRIEVK